MSDSSFKNNKSHMIKIPLNKSKGIPLARDITEIKPGEFKGGDIHIL
jgi:hypothetical protein